MVPFVMTAMPANQSTRRLDKRYRHGGGHSNLVVVVRLRVVGAFQRNLRNPPDTPAAFIMTTSVPPYSRVASIFSILFRGACYVFFRIIPGRVAPPIIVLFYGIYTLAYWLGGRQVPALDRAKLEAAKEKQANGSGNGHVDDTPAIAKYRDTDNAPGTTMLLTLPSSSRMLRRISLAANSILFLMAMDYVSKPHFQPANDLQFARVGAVDSTSAKIVVRYPGPPEPSTTAATTTTTTTDAPIPTPSIIEAIHDAVDGILPEITLPEIVEELLTPAPTPRTTSLRVQWRNAGLASGTLESVWTDGPIVEMSESRDWVGMVKLTGLQASTEYEYRLVDLDGELWSSAGNQLSFRTTPDSRLAGGSHFRFVSTSCVIPNFPYSVFAESTHIRGFDLLADHIWPAQLQAKETPSEVQEEPVAAPAAEESPEPTDEEAPESAIPTYTVVDATPSPLDSEQVPLVSTEVLPETPSKPAPMVEFLMMMGDFIYADVPYYFGDTIQAYRRLYRRVYASKSFRRIYERLPTYNIYDDHEFINNFGANGNDSSSPYLNASQAYEIYNGQANPDAKTKGVYYYDFRHGDTAFFVMDTRRYRSPPPTQKPYPFPMNLFTPLIQAVAEGRNPFAAYFGEPNSPVSSNPIAEAVDETSRTMLGEAQLAALHSWIADVNQTATWKFVVSSVPLTAMWAGYDGHVDLWAGYMHERDTVLSLLSSVPNVVVLSGDRHEFAAVEFPRGKHLVREYSTSPLNQFYVPWAHTLSPKNARNITLVRQNIITTETGEEHIEEVAEEVEEEVLVKYHPSGNHKWTTIEVDSTDSNAPTLKVELYVNGKLEWDQKVVGEPVELSHPTALAIPAQVQGVVQSLKNSLKGWFRSH
ncbi:PhoD-like phosphatase [Rhizoctonia solani]|uniref:PhoD-like phosphatase n=2 Tax=Rhizoctonia solani TaxID=456999 RepID=A0A8H7LPW5_9AGAM|nr:PhoD-like phosphatase [Rhizoctonia solani]